METANKASLVHGELGRSEFRVRLRVSSAGDAPFPRPGKDRMLPRSSQLCILQ